MNEHLTDLRLERVLTGEIDPRDEPHLTSCETCQARFDAAKVFEQAHPIRPPVSPQKRSTAPWVGLSLAAAAALAIGLVWSRPPSVQDRPEFISKGGFSFEVHVHDGEQSRQALPGETVHPGDRLGFRVRAKRAGHLLIVGVDATGEQYVCYPQSGGGKSAPLSATEAMNTLGEAIKLDKTLGEERLQAIFCETPFELSELTSKTGCVRRDLAVDKVVKP